MSEAENSAKQGAALFDLSGKCAVVLGGTTGIGRALSVGLVQRARMLLPQGGAWSRWRRRLRP